MKIVQCLCAIVFIAMVGFVSSANAMLPDFYSQPSSVNKKRSNLSLAPNELIDPFSGGLSIVHTDMVVPGNGGMDIKIQRVYSSNAIYHRPSSGSGTSLTALQETTPYGLGWSMHFGRIRLTADFLFDDWRSTLNCERFGQPGNVSVNPILEMPDGTQRQLFCNDFASTYSTNATFVTKDNWAVDPIQNVTSTTGLLVIDPNGMKYTMNYRLTGGVTGQRDQIVWYTSKIEDRNGNTINITYKSVSDGESPLFDRVTGSDGRVVQFFYSNSNNTKKAKLTRVQYEGRRVDYTHTNFSPDYPIFEGRQYSQLTKVTLPGGNLHNNWKYSYYNRASGAAGDNLLRVITYPRGGTTTYDYEYHCFLYSNCATLGQYYSLVVKSKINDGRGIAKATWNFNYASTNDQQYGITTINGPRSIEEYRHYRVNRLVTNGTTYTGFTPELWRVGLLVEKSTKTKTGTLVQKESYAYNKRKISNQVYERPPYTQAGANLSDNAVYQHYLTERKINRDGADYVTKYQNFADNINPHRIVETGQASRTTNLTYFPRVNGQNIVSMVKDESLGSAANRKISRTFDSKGNLRTKTEYGVKTTYTYHNDGEVWTVKDANDHITRYTRYKLGQVRTISQPEGVVVERGVDAFGNISFVKDGRGNTTEYVYDNVDRLTKVTPPFGAETTIGWESSSKRTLTRGGYTQELTFDGFGRESCSVTEDIYVGYGYDADGNRTHRTYPNYSSCGFATRTRYTFDELNRPRRTTHPDNAYSEITYLADNKRRLRNERAKLFTHTHRSYGDPDQTELMQITGPNSLNLSIERNALGQPESITRNGVVRSFNYASKVFVMTETNPETGLTTYGRDAVGNMTSKKVGASATTLYVYDDLNRLKTINYPSNTPDVAYTYDKNSNLKTANSGIAQLTYTYDKNNNLTREQHNIDGINYYITNTYTELDHLNTVTYPNRAVITYAPNDLGWPTKAAPYITDVDYDAFGRPTKMDYMGGRKWTQTYWQRGWPRLTTVDGGIAKRNRTYDLGGNLKTLDDQLNNVNDRSLGYDDLDRLTSASGPWGTGSVGYSTDDDITDKRMGTTSLGYTYTGSANRVTAVSGLTNFITPAQYTYDAYGNITQKANNSVGWRYEYDDASNLRKVFDKNSNALLRTFDYSGQRQRLRSITPDETRVHIVSKSGQILSEYVTQGSKPNIDNVYLGNRLIAELESQVNPLPPASIFGWGYGNSQHRERYTRNFTIDELPESAEICVNGYDIDTTTEVEVRVNGTRVGYLRRGGDPTETCFTLTPPLLSLGVNTIEFIQANPGETWGVTAPAIELIFPKKAFLPAIFMILEDEEVAQ